MAVTWRTKSNGPPDSYVQNRTRSSWCLHCNPLLIGRQSNLQSNKTVICLPSSLAQWTNSVRNHWDLSLFNAANHPCILHPIWEIIQLQFRFGFRLRRVFVITGSTGLTRHIYFGYLPKPTTSLEGEATTSCIIFLRPPYSCRTCSLQQIRHG